MSGNTISRGGWGLANVNYLLFILIIFLILFNIPYFSSSYFPRGDSLGVAVRFQYYYNHFFIEGELPQWVAYGLYGYKSITFQLGAFTPMIWLAGALGVIFQVENAFFVFKTGMLFEQLLLLYGTYLLCKVLFKDKLTIFIVCLFSIGSFFWFKHYLFDFRMVYNLPLACGLLIGFLKRQRPELLWLAGLALVTFSVGYGTVFQVFALLIVMVPMAWRYRASFSMIFARTPVNLGLFVLFFFYSFLLLYTWAGALDGLDVFVPGRDENMRVGLVNFLTYGPFPNSGVIREFFSGWMSVDRQTSYYIGILPIIAIVLALAYVRNREFISFFSALVFVVLVSMGGSFSMLSYFIPGMEFYRHVGLVLAVAKFLALICAGFGIDLILGFLRNPEMLRERFKSWHLLAVLFVLWTLFDLSLGREFMSWVLGWEEVPAASGGAPADRVALITAMLRYATYFAAFVAIFIITKKFAGRKFASFSMVIIFVLVALGDVVSFQGETYYNRHRLPAELNDKVSSLNADEFTHNLYRQSKPDSKRQKDAMEILLLKSKGRATYSYYYVGGKFDPCTPVLRTDMFPTGVARLLKARGGRPQLWPDGAFVPAYDAPLLAVLGCSKPKVRLVPRAATFFSEDEIYDAMRKEKNLDKLVFMRGMIGLPEGVESPALPNGKTGDAEVVEFSANEFTIKAHVDANHPVWLVVADSYHSGWRATVNNQAAIIQKAYLAFKAVKIPPGENMVKFSFDEGLSTFVLFRFGPLAWLLCGIAVCLFILGDLMGIRRFSIAFQDK